MACKIMITISVLSLSILLLHWSIQDNENVSKKFLEFLSTVFSCLMVTLPIVVLFMVWQ